MNLNTLMRQADAYTEALQARSEAADEAYLAAYESAEAALSFDGLLEALVDLPDEAKQAALHEAAQGHDTGLLAETYERLLQDKTAAVLRRASAEAQALAAWQYASPYETEGADDARD
jgi:hypothetical protein